MSVKLRDLIKNVRSCKTAADERAAISKECANIRASIREDKSDYRRRNVAKLLYIHMLGYSTHWGQMEVVRLLSSGSFSDKRFGYLALMLLLDESQEVLTLVTQILKNDLENPNHFIVGLALCATGNISSVSIARDLAPEVEKLLGSSHPYIRKKAALCTIRILRKCPDLMENFVGKVRTLLNEKSHGVLITAVTLVLEMCKLDPENVKEFRKLVPTLVRIQKNLLMSGYAPEYDISQVTDPFLQVKVLRLLGVLGKDDVEASDIMNDILAQVATNTDNTKNVGNAILYECVQTIMNIESEGGLRVLAINVLGRFLSNRDNNIRYVALNTLSKVVNVDIEAVQRHRNTIVDCLKDIDISIRRRALDLIYALINESNVKILAHELLNFLSSTTVELKADLATKLCNASERYAPSKRWYVDTILKVMSVAGNFLPDEVLGNLISVISVTPELHSYAAQKMYLAANDDLSQQPLVRVAVWTIGEYGDMLVSNGISEQSIIDLFRTILASPSINATTRSWVLTAVVKLTTRFSQASYQAINELVSKYKDNIETEIQQRACEYSQILATSENIRKSLLDRMPVQEENTSERNMPQASAVLTKEKSLLDDLDEIPSNSTQQPASKPTTNGNGLDIMNELFGDLPSSTPQVSQPQATQGNTSSLDDLLGLSSASPSVSTPAASPAPFSQGTISSASQPLNGPLPPMTAFEKNGLKIVFQIVKQASHPNITLINIKFTNSLGSPMNNFEFKVAVPKYLKLQVNTPSGNSIPPNNSGVVTQQIKIMNTMHGEKPVMLKVKIDYELNGSKVAEIADVNQFPDGV